ncbi:MAG TPA: multicopper oxidase domain-containing protein, partial [Nitrososphaera sp.]|nr:multicopper oxidase domain-containing protein [Nitrososphaera sp.]
MDQKRNLKGIAIISAAVAIPLVTAGILAVFASQQGRIILENNSAFASDTVNGAGLVKGYTPKTIEYTLVAEETTLEIAPDVRVPAWTYNGTIPGPTLRAVEGDRVIIKFINTTPMPHTVHLHGDHDELDDGVFQEVQPNETYVY